MLRSLDGLAVRQLRTRPLRALLTAFGVVLGVGMVFGVLLLVGTIRHTFDDLIDSAWGKHRPRRHGDRPAACCRRPRSTRVRATPGVARRRARWSAASFTRLDARGQAVDGRRRADARSPGYDPRAHAAVRLPAGVAGRGRAPGREIALERNWARDRGVARRRRAARRRRRPGRARAARRRHLHVLRRPRRSAARASRRCRSPTRGAIMDMPTGWHQISVAVDRPAPASRRRSGGSQRALGPGVEVKTPQGYGDDVEQQLDGAQRRPLLLLGRRAVRRRLPDPQLVQHDRAAAHARARHAAHARRHAPDGRRARSSSRRWSSAWSARVLGLGARPRPRRRPDRADARLRHAGRRRCRSPPAPAVIAVRHRPARDARRRALWPARRAGARLADPRGARRRAARSARRRRARALIGLALFLPGVLLGGAASGSATTPAARCTALLGIAHDDGDVRRHGAGRAVRDHARSCGCSRVPLRRLSPTGGRLAADARAANPARTAATAAALTIGLSVVVVNSALSVELRRHGQRPDRPRASRATSRSSAVGARWRPAAAPAIAPRCRERIARAARGARRRHAVAR